jgi:hypothetical protein
MKATLAQRKHIGGASATTIASSLASVEQPSIGVLAEADDVK